MPHLLDLFYLSLQINFKNFKYENLLKEKQSIPVENSMGICI
jgi:hypothetical protein